MNSGHILDSVRCAGHVLQFVEHEDGVIRGEVVRITEESPDGYVSGDVLFTFDWVDVSVGAEVCA